ncbi:MAG TPA: hypothetical protein VJ299_09435, partial [Steroidobacteraceae bacterium]|nr:hypothetical protein [Steroidobacteraceae bacterium]
MACYGQSFEGLRNEPPVARAATQNALGAFGSPSIGIRMALNALNPKPDNVIIITDGLPTQGASAPLIRKTIDGDDRLKLFERAFTKYPR